MSFNGDNKIIRDFESYEEGLQNIVINGGDSILLDYLLKRKFDKPDIYKDDGSLYLLGEIYDHLKNYELEPKKIESAIKDYLDELRKTAIKNLGQDFDLLKVELQKAEPSYERLMYLINAYFFEKLEYLLINLLFKTQLDFVKALISMSLDHLPKEIKAKKESEDKERRRIIREDLKTRKAKKQLELIPFKLESVNYIKDYPANVKLISFKVLYDVEILGTSYRGLEKIEKDYISKEKERYESFKRRKKELEKNHERRIVRIEKLVMNKAKKHAKRIFKTLHKQVIKQVNLR